MKWKHVTISIIFLTVVIVGLIGYFNNRNKERYENDVEYTYDIAKNLGYTPLSHLNFHRSYSFGVDAYYDHILLLFTTQKSLEEFDTMVDSLGLQALGSQNRSSHAKRYSFLYNDELKKDLTLRSKNFYDQSERANKDFARKHPHVTVWSLFDPNLKRAIIIRYATANEEDNLWEYDGRVFEDAVVEIDFNRH